MSTTMCFRSHARLYKSSLQGHLMWKSEVLAASEAYDCGRQCIKINDMGGQV